MDWTLFCQMVLLFFACSCAGWLMEVTLKYIQFHRFINRGFMIGPYCPVYGWGAVAVTVLVGGMIGRKGTVSEIFWAGYVLCGLLEYLTSWLMEKLFHARWWDYSHKPMNLHGRIWVGNLLLFGAGSVVIVLGIDPVFFSLVQRLSPFWLHTLTIGIMILMVTDYICSHILMNVVRKEIDAQEGDNTEEISIRVRALLRDRHLLLRRIEQAYPDLHTQPHWLTQQVRQAHREYKEARRNAVKLLKEIRAEKKMLLEDTAWRERLDAALEAEKNTLKKLRALQKKQLHHRKENWDS